MKNNNNKLNFKFRITGKYFARKVLTTGIYFDFFFLNLEK
jgi:hypothetical protein